MKIGLVGLGIVGTAMKQSFVEKKINLYTYDKYKYIGKIKDLLECNIIFLALPTPYDIIKKEYNKSAIYEICEYFNKTEKIFTIVLKSTIEPGTSDELAKKYKNLHFVHNPEFLSTKTAYNDFHNQAHIVLGKSDNCSEERFNDVVLFYKDNYPEALISYCSSKEAESMKIYCNSFYAIKIQYFTELFLMCQTNGTNYTKIKDLMLKNGWINKHHTNIPGQDGEKSYGGLCFPKDTNALLSYMQKNLVPSGILEACIKERNEMRND